MAPARPGVAKGNSWGGIIALVVVLAVAFPNAIPALISIGVVCLIIWGAAKSNAAKPGIASTVARTQSVGTSDAVGVSSSPATGSATAEMPFFPSRADTGEVFDFARRGMDARALVDDVRYSPDGLFEIDLRVIPRGAADYRTTIVTAVPGDRVDQVQKGKSLRLRVDPTRPGGPIFVL